MAHPWSLSQRFIPDQIPRAKYRTILTRQITPDFRFGLEYNAGVSELGIVANYRALRETRTRPALIFGTSSDRIGTPYGQSYFATISKSLKPQIGLPIAPYVGLSYSGFEKRVLYPWGLNASLGGAWSGSLLHDGVRSHLAATYSWQNYSATFLGVGKPTGRRDLGINLSVSF